MRNLSAIIKPLSVLTAYVMISSSCGYLKPDYTNAVKGQEIKGKVSSIEEKVLHGGEVGSSTSSYIVQFENGQKIRFPNYNWLKSVKAGDSLEFFVE